MNTPAQRGCFARTHRYDARTAKGAPIEQLAAHLPWVCFRKPLEKSLCRSKRATGGRPPFAASRMVNVLVLPALSHLSDAQPAYPMRDRLSCRRGFGLDWQQRLPAANPLGGLREPLPQAGGGEKLVTQFDTYLAASLVPGPTQRNTREEHATGKAGEGPPEWEAPPAKRRQQETEARWTKTHGACPVGYNNHGNVAKPHNLIRRDTGTAAAVPDRQVLGEGLQPKTAGGAVWGDAAYRAEELAGPLKPRALRSKIP